MSSPWRDTHCQSLACRGLRTAGQGRNWCFPPTPPQACLYHRTFLFLVTFTPRVQHPQTDQLHLTQARLLREACRRDPPAGVFRPDPGPGAKCSLLKGGVHATAKVLSSAESFLWQGKGLLLWAASSTTLPRASVFLTSSAELIIVARRELCSIVTASQGLTQPHERRCPTTRLL